MYTYYIVDRQPGVDMIVSDTLLTLSCRRWNVPVLAHLESAGGAPFTFTALREALLVCRDSLTRTLETLARPDTS
jgi:hypothetical protein